MLDLTRTRIEASQEMPVGTLYPISYEGQALQHMFEGSLGKVKPSDGTANSIFAGFAQFQNVSQTTSVFFETQIVPSSAPYTITLQNTPTAYTDMLVKTSASVVYTNQATLGSLATTQYYLGANGVVTFYSDAAGLTINFTYRFALTVAQQSALYGDQPIGRTASSIVNAVSVITKGDIYTDQYDTSADWGSVLLNTTIINAGANGRLYIGGTGAPLGGFARVVNVPSSDVPFLGVRVSH